MTKRRVGSDPDQRFRTLVESVKDYAIFTLDLDGRVQSWNAGAELVKGYTRDEIVGKRIDVFYGEQDRKAGLPDQLLAEAADKGRVENEGWRVRKDGTRFWADVVITAVRDETGDIIGFTKVTRDLTQRRDLEEERVNRARAEEAIRLREEFLAIASHELKTPLTTLQIELHTLQNRFEQAPPDKQDERTLMRLRRAARNADRLAALIESLLDVSRLATGKVILNPEPLELSAAISQLIDSMHSAAVRARCEVSFSSTGPIFGAWDRLRLDQVVMNLLSNAFKYGAEHPVTVAVSTEDSDAIIEVSDQGPGIPEKDLVRIFERFERASPIRNFGGLGLGLYVSREIVQLQGGSIGAINLPGGGARLTVRLPIVVRAVLQVPATRMDA